MALRCRDPQRLVFARIAARAGAARGIAASAPGRPPPPRSRSPSIRASSAATISRTPSSCCAARSTPTGEAVDTSFGFTAKAITPAILFGSVAGEVVVERAAPDRAQRPAVRADAPGRALSGGDGGGRALAQPRPAFLQSQPPQLHPLRRRDRRRRSACGSRRPAADEAAALVPAARAQPQPGARRPADRAESAARFGIWGLPSFCYACGSLAGRRGVARGMALGGPAESAIRASAARRSTRPVAPLPHRPGRGLRPAAPPAAAAQAPTAPTREEIERRRPPSGSAAAPARLTVEGGVERAPCALDRPEYQDIRFTLTDAVFDDLARSSAQQELRPAFAALSGPRASGRHGLRDSRPRRRDPAQGRLYRRGRGA